ncbi:hypothetical protein THAOC_05480 [Thalassiosira oceanica]|uniref:Uncharacterized protein n=1 Tax=Thalassiosira oceanica TaxID=159749 RepID=K0TGY6_THAOC|nr:hypothetical protein THAOC_05480 [Thalassiosira oceanica]|eukprot:EJK72936.1 hypothetical protein THAOC_05480 [Thalassiosira oceanica]
MLSGIREMATSAVANRNEEEEQRSASRAAMSNASKRLTHDAADELVGVQEHPVPEAAAEVARAGHARWDAPAAHIGKEVVDLSALRHLLIALTPLLEALEGVFSVGRRVPVLLLIGGVDRFGQVRDVTLGRHHT